MKKVDGFTISIIGILVLFTITYFVLANKASYNFAKDFTTELYNLKIDAIKEQAKIYGENTTDLFKDKQTTYITVDDLAKIGYVINNDGIVTDPRNENKNLNDVKLKLTYQNNQVEVKVL